MPPSTPKAPESGEKGEDIAAPKEESTPSGKQRNDYAMQDIL